MVPEGDDQAALTPKDSTSPSKREGEEEGRESNKKAKSLRTEGGGDEEENLKNDKSLPMKLGFKKVTWKLSGEVMGTSKLDGEAGNSKIGSRTLKHQGREAMITDCSHRCNRSVRARTNTSAVINKQRRQPCTMPPRCGGLLSTLLQMGINSPVCVLRKSITRSDINKGQHRLLLPKDILNKPLLEGMMTAAEKTMTTANTGLPIKMLDRLGREYKLTLRFVTSIHAYRIMGPDYNRLVEDNGFEVGHFLDLWAFRVGRQIGSGGAIGDEAEGAPTSSAGELRMGIEYENAEEEEIKVVHDDDHEAGCSGYVSADQPCRAPTCWQSGPPPTLASGEEEEKEAARTLLILREAVL